MLKSMSWLLFVIHSFLAFHEKAKLIFIKGMWFLLWGDTDLFIQKCIRLWELKFFFFSSELKYDCLIEMKPSQEFPRFPATDPIIHNL